MPFSQPALLRRIFELGCARDESGKLQVYRVAHLLARSVNFREGTFTGNIDAPEQDGRMAWQVSFTLREKMSADERKEQRAMAKISTKKQTADGGGSATAGAAESPEKIAQMQNSVQKHISGARSR